MVVLSSNALFEGDICSSNEGRIASRTPRRLRAHEAQVRRATVIMRAVAPSIRGSRQVVERAGAMRRGSHGSPPPRGPLKKLENAVSCQVFSVLSKSMELHDNAPRPSKKKCSKWPISPQSS